jgi:hypothetical protein
LNHERWGLRTVTVARFGSSVGGKKERVGCKYWELFVAAGAGAAAVAAVGGRQANPRAGTG